MEILDVKKKMKYQPNRNYKSSDLIMTPPFLTKAVVEHFKPLGKVLEPCKGTGNFLQFLPNAEWCEITEGRDFFDYNKKVDWIITNPPWSKIRNFLIHSMEIALNIVFLITVNHLWTRARIKKIKEMNFGIKEICLIDAPKEFHNTGFQLAAIHLQKGYKGLIILSDLETIGG